jgi:hypothetical protein
LATSSSAIVRDLLSDCGERSFCFDRAGRTCSTGGIVIANPLRRVAIIAHVDMGRPRSWTRCCIKVERSAPTNARRRRAMDSNELGA